MSVGVLARGLWPRRIGSAAALFLCAALGVAQVAVPPLTGRVVDLTGTLDSTQKASLEQTLAAFEARKGTQIAVLLLPTTEPETIEQFSLRVAEQWKLGRKRVDDGAILIVAKNDRAMRIEVGYGIEGALTDVTSKRIISEAITPAFQRGDFYGGIRAGVDRIIGVIEGEPLPAAPPRSSRQDGAGEGLGQFIPIAFMLALVVGGVLRRMLGRFLGAVVTGGALGGLAWLLIGGLSIAIAAGIIGFLFTLLGGGMMGRPGGWQTGRGGFGGGFPGGFGRGGGGFGGGGGFRGGGGTFGGGGASGRW
jgi:uncharacterized protein